MKTLAVFGDSWPYGAELNKGEKPFGNILHAMLGTDKYYNMSHEGTAIDSLVMQLDKFIKKKKYNDCVCVFFITNPTRQLYYKDNQFKVIRPTGAKNDYLKKLYFTELQDKQPKGFPIERVIVHTHGARLFNGSFAKNVPQI